MKILKRLNANTATLKLGDVITYKSGCIDCGSYKGIVNENQIFREILGATCKECNRRRGIVKKNIVQLQRYGEAPETISKWFKLLNITIS